MTIYKSLLLIATLVFSLNTVQAKKAQIVFDDGTAYQNCILDGGDVANASTRYACCSKANSQGKRQCTVCDKKPTDKDAACSTETVSTKQASDLLSKRPEYFTNKRSKASSDTNKTAPARTPVKRNTNAGPAPRAVSHANTPAPRNGSNNRVKTSKRTTVPVKKSKQSE